MRGFNLEQCANIYRNAAINVDSMQLCAGSEDGRDSCKGDSGNMNSSNA